MLINPLGAISLIFLAVCAVQSQDKGFLRSCDSTRYPFSMDWTPKTLKSGVSYTINLNAVAAKPFTSGRWCLKVWLHGIPDPIYDDCKNVKCREIRTVAMQYVNFQLRCPIAQGDVVNIPNFQMTIDPTAPLPGGRFHVNTTIDNENNERFLCVTGDIDIDDDFDEDF